MAEDNKGGIVDTVTSGVGTAASTVGSAVSSAAGTMADLAKKAVGALPGGGAKKPAARRRPSKPRASAKKRSAKKRVAAKTRGAARKTARGVKDGKAKVKRAVAAKGRKKLADPVSQVVSRSGDEWALGEHRLLCGASEVLCDQILRFFERTTSQQATLAESGLNFSAVGKLRRVEGPR